MTNQEQIAKLEAESTECQARAYDLQAEIDRLRGEPLGEEFHRALAAEWRGEPAAKDRKERAYIRLQASRVVSFPHVITSIGEADRPAVLAEVERLRAECKHEDDGGPFFAKCGKCGETLDDFGGTT